MRVEASPASLVRLPASAAAPVHGSFREQLADRTPLRSKDATALLSAAWAAVVGKKPDASTSRLLTAHWALETDNGRAMPGHNFAGIKATPSAPGANFLTAEGYGATRREVSARFRVYESAQSGAHDYVRLLATRYPAALEAARAGDVQGFAQALAQGGYFTADPRAYASGLAQRLSELCSPAAASSAPARAPAPGTLAQAALGGLLQALREPEPTPSEDG